jgi:hypothetical protein
MRGHALGPFAILSGVVQIPNLRVQGVLVVNVGDTLQLALSASAVDPVLLKVRPYTQVATPTGTNSLKLGKTGTLNAYLDTADSTPGTQGTLSAEKAFVITADTTLIASLTSTAVAASKALTISATTSANTQTVTIGATTYTFNTSLTNTANNVLIGSSAGAMGDNLAAAINAGAGSGTLYGAGTVANASVSAVSNGSGVVTVTALTAGAAGNSIAISETLTNSAWAGGATALSGGDDASTAGQMFIFIDA